MIPSLRCLQLLAFGSGLWLLSVLVPGAWIAGALFLLVLFLLCLQDAVHAPGAEAFDVERVLPPRFSLGQEHTLEIHLANHSPHSMKVQIRDELPEALVPLNRIEPVQLPVKGRARVRYLAKAVQRGAFEFGDTVLRIRHGLGLVQKEITLNLPERIKIYPRFKGVDDYDLLAKIDRRDEVVRRPRRIQGPGTDFESLRPYLPGEDLRNIDWKASARRNTLISRNRQVEKGQQVALLLDSGRLMGERIAGATRLDHALNAVVMLSHVAQKRGDSISVTAFSNRVESFLPPVRGPAIMAKVLESIYAVQPQPVESDYWQVTAEVMSMLRRRSLVVMLTDVLDGSSSTGLIHNLTRAARKHLVLCVVLAEPRVAKTAEAIPVSIGDAYRKAAAADLLRRRRLALERMRSRGVLILETSPEQLNVRLVRTYLEIRRADLQ